jgi:hypothetical protein
MNEVQLSTAWFPRDPIKAYRRISAIPPKFVEHFIGLLVDLRNWEIPMKTSPCALMEQLFDDHPWYVNG